MQIHVMQGERSPINRMLGNFELRTRYAAWAAADEVEFAIDVNGILHDRDGMAARARRTSASRTRAG
ncbi:MAG: hypothetical protein H6809_07945 [Phycisphaeraceae bacterium]|nr:hypothetical protein [Phycisphaeraceae bacterium]